MKRFIFFFSALLLVVGLQAQTTIEAPELGGAIVLSEEEFLELLAENNVDITELSTKVSELSGNAILNSENIDPDDLQCVSQQLGNGANVNGTNGKSRIGAGFMAFFLGGLGIHRFYLGQVGTGLTYLLLCWTGVPAVFGLVDSIILFCTPHSKTLWI